MTYRIAIPNKGRLFEGSLELLRKIGLKLPSQIGRSLIAHTPDGRWQILFARASDIPEYVELGAAEAGITGQDLVVETGARVQVQLGLNFGHCRMVLAVPETSPARRAEELQDGAHVATSFPNTARRYFESLGRNVVIVPVGGATEITPFIGLADAIVDLTETGDTLKKNHLVSIADIGTSVATVITATPPQKREVLDELIAALRSVIDAARKRYLMANLPRRALEPVRALLPGITGPTVMPLLGQSEEWVAIHAVVAEDEINALIPKLKGLGATGILVLPIERMVS